jgi:hypothetical protein
LKRFYLTFVKQSSRSRLITIWKKAAQIQSRFFIT